MTTCRPSTESPFGRSVSVARTNRASGATASRVALWRALRYSGFTVCTVSVSARIRSSATWRRMKSNSSRCWSRRNFFCPVGSAGDLGAGPRRMSVSWRRAPSASPRDQALPSRVNETERPSAGHAGSDSGAGVAGGPPLRPPLVPNGTARLLMLPAVSGNAGALAAGGPPRANRGASRPMATLQRLGAGLVGGALGACTSGGEPPLRLGTTYTVEQSGALALLDSLARPTPTTVVGPSGQILGAAARGDLDVVITHAPSLEQRLLVAPGHVLLACPFVASRFAIVGPAADPAHVGAAPGAADAFRRIAAAAGPFVSRGDSSGTHVKEVALWQAAHVRPAGSWYIQSGADQVTTLHVADERDAYALADLPTLAKLTGLRLQVLFATDTALTNPYTLYVVNKPGPGPGPDPGPRATAEAFARWAMSVARPRILELRLPDGTPGFVTRGGECAAPDTSAPSAGRSAERRLERAPPPQAAPTSAAVLLGRWDYSPPSRAAAAHPPCARR